MNRFSLSEKVGARVLTFLSLLLILCGIVFGISFIFQFRKVSSSPVDLNGDPVVFSKGDVPSKTEIEKMNVQDEIKSSRSPARLRVPSVGLDVPVGSIRAVDGVINPPKFDRAYVVDNIGSSLDKNSDGTVFLVTHSVRRGFAPGNALIDVSEKRARVNVGDKIYVADNVFRVTGFENVARKSIADSPRIWENVPGRLVLITCMQRSNGKPVENAVIFAQKE